MAYDFAEKQRALQHKQRHRSRALWPWLMEHYAERLWLTLAWLFIIVIGLITGYSAYQSYATAQGIFLIRASPEMPTINTRAFLIAGRDAWGNRALFDVVISSRSIGWVHGSTEALEQDGVRITEEALPAFVFENGMARRIAIAEALIAVGVASQEGDKATETERARQRAEQTARWIRRFTGFGGPIHELNLGQYAEPCADCETEATSWQRPLSLIAVRITDPDVDLRAALMNALGRARNLPSPSSYSAFDLRLDRDTTGRE